jgi:hypothetical protein
MTPVRIVQLTRNIEELESDGKKSVVTTRSYRCRLLRTEGLHLLPLPPYHPLSLSLVIRNFLSRYHQLINLFIIRRLSIVDPLIRLHDTSISFNLTAKLIHRRLSFSLLLCFPSNSHIPRMCCGRSFVNGDLPLTPHTEGLAYSVLDDGCEKAEHGERMNDRNANYLV